MKKASAILTMGAVFGLIWSASADLVWIEGESCMRTNLAENRWLKGDNPRLLSGGDTFAGIAEKGTLPSPAFALWKIEVPKSGLYHVYFRHGYLGHHGEMRYRFLKADANGKPLGKPDPQEGWVEFDLLSAIMDRIQIGQHRTMEWTRQEPVQLEAGTYLLDLQVTGANPAKTGPNDPVWTVIDVIALSAEPFTPRGANKPGAEGDKAAPTGSGGTDYY
jgi:hypothetical protein